MREEFERREEPLRHEHDAIPPELDPAFAEFDDGPSRTLANRMRPALTVAALLALAAMAAFLFF